jgi:ribonuclease HIII
MSLPKGAAPIVIETGLQLVEKYGVEILDKVAKCHFKTKSEILSRISSD